MTVSGWSTIGPSGSDAFGGRWGFHAARWTLLLGAALVTRLCFPPPTAVGFLSGVLAPVLVDGMILSLFWLILRYYRRETYAQLREMAFFAALIALIAFISAVLARVAPGRSELAPVPFAAILVTMLYNGRLSVFFSATVAILLGLQPGLRETDALFFGLIGGVAAGLGIRVVRRRKHLYVPIVVITAAYTLAAFAVGLRDGWSLHAIIASSAAGGANALVSASVAMLLVPLAESATHITTDVTLLELSDPGRPLLRRLATEAPGTWAHSLAMANLCEEGCNAVGANGLLGRVGCYYHDVGKLRAPLHFIENQATGVNPHDRLAPEQSAEIIRSHVAQGLGLAHDAGLPQVIRAFIAEHHGTMPINYFLERARGRDAGVPVDEGRFRYPGPRPRSAETAVAMLADTVEASVRLLHDPTLDHVRETITDLVDEKITSGQLSEAPLTLRDLGLVREAFVRTLTGMYHSRIDYPRPSGPVATGFPHAQSA